VMILKNLIVKVYEKVNTADIIPPISSWRWVDLFLSWLALDSDTHNKMQRSVWIFLQEILCRELYVLY
jgi:hypothetical protein